MGRMTGYEAVNGCRVDDSRRPRVATEMTGVTSVKFYYIELNRRSRHVLIIDADCEEKSNSKSWYFTRFNPFPK
ncbi:hypothetical protein PILCRDRAFT_308812 [Piloderma croceum F 1598]|jgi:hypothetical protein|uniref:Uncharacterized protein n=1 Tax=Piloderma croceum (strain F 1598) TaxID=765440 RepID=A0A0C3BJQ0_PILCF|nr:hypothetical protein PILCRDRAFT_308812 [Piloderma croceum F 1598]